MTMQVLLAATLLLAGASGLAVVLNRDPKRQIFALSANGMVLALLFLEVQAPDVALSEIGVGAALVPLLFLVTLSAVANNRADP